jgi:uncharacterized phage protein (TIGR01671 family)
MEEKMENSRFEFRAWNKNNESMIEKVQDCKSDGFNLHDSCFGDYLYRDFYVVMQYTGLKDKNGKKIYEGDVLAYKTSDSCYSKYGETYIVKFENGQFVCDYQYGNVYRFLNDLNVEVIGNIYQNPNL